MKLLIIGGTVFLGRHLVLAAKERGHEVTIFHRGNHPSPFSDVREVLGDRATDLDRVAGEHWDAVIDTSAYTPEAVEKLAEALGAATDRYVFISSISVYADLSQPGITETSPTAKLADPAERRVTMETYGALKALSEEAAAKAFGDRTLVIRPGLIVGPNDATARFTYWPRRLRAGGVVLVPGKPEQPVQFVDVRDLASFTIDLIERRASGIVHVTGPLGELTIERFLEALNAMLSANATFRYVPESQIETLLAEGEQIPMWLPREFWNLNRMDLALAESMGLKLRPLEETVGATLKWADEDGGRSETMARGHLTREREQEMLRGLAAQQATEEVGK